MFCVVGGYHTNKMSVISTNRPMALRAYVSAYDTLTILHGRQIMDMAGLELICGTIGFLFIGATLGLVIGLNTPDRSKR